MVDALLSDRTVKLPQDAKRSSAALKYLFTELMCHRCGGPETLTGNGLEETRLLASSKELFQLLRVAEAASDHIDTRLRTALLQCSMAEATSWRPLLRVIEGIEGELRDLDEVKNAWKEVFEMRQRLEGGVREALKTGHAVKVCPLPPSLTCSHFTQLLSPSLTFPRRTFGTARRRLVVARRDRHGAAAGGRRAVPAPPSQEGRHRRRDAAKARDGRPG